MNGYTRMSRVGLPHGAARAVEVKLPILRLAQTHHEVIQRKPRRVWRSTEQRLQILSIATISMRDFLGELLVGVFGGLLPASLLLKKLPAQTEPSITQSRR